MNKEFPTMWQILARGLLQLAGLSLIAAQIPAAHAAAPTLGGMPAVAMLAQAAATRAPVMVSQPVVQRLPGDPPSVAVQTPAPPPVDETEKERKARLKQEVKAQKQAAKAEKDRIKKEEKDRKRAERKAKGGSSTGKKILGCVGGGLLMGGLTALLGGSNKQIAGAAVAGCVTGFAFASLSKKDNQDLEAYVNDDFMLREDSCSDQWVAKESGQTATITCGPETVRQMKHTFVAADNVVFDEANFVAKESAKYASTSLRIRSSPSVTDNANIVGGYDLGDRILTYGTTPDGAWTYVVERGMDGRYELMGYVATQFVVDRPPANRAIAGQFARLKPPPPVVAKGAKSRRAAPVAVAAVVPVRAKRTIVATANTRCKSANVSVGNEAKSKSGCGGAQLAMIPSSERKEKWA